MEQHAQQPVAQPLAGRALVRGALTWLPVGLGLLLLLLGVEQSAAVVFYILVYAMVLVGLLVPSLSISSLLDNPGWVFLLLSHLVWFAYAAVYQAVAPNLWFGDWTGVSIQNRDLIMATVSISLFLAMNGLGYWSVVKAKPRLQPQNGSTQWSFAWTRRQRDVTLLFCFAIGLVPYLVFGGSLSSIVSEILSGRSNKSWAYSATASEAYAGDAKMTLLVLTGSFLVCAAVLSLYLAIVEKRNLPRRLMYLGLFTVSATIVYFDRGTRSTSLMMVLPPVLLYGVEQSKKASKLALRILLFAIAFLILTQVQLLYRTDAARSDLSAATVIDGLVPKSHVDFFTETAFAVSVQDQLGDYLYEQPLLAFVYNLIPRFLWPKKPLPETLYWYSLYRWGIDIWRYGGNALPSVVGQYFMNWGLFGVAWIGLCYGAFAGFCTNLIRRHSKVREYTLFVFLALSFMAVTFRYLSPGFHYPVLVLGMALYIWSRFRPRKSPEGV